MILALLQKGLQTPKFCGGVKNRGSLLVTNNRSSMPRHLADHLAEGHHVPGIFILNPELSLGETIEELTLIAEASFADEYMDRISYLPLT